MRARVSESFDHDGYNNSLREVRENEAHRCLGRIAHALNTGQRVTALRLAVSLIGCLAAILRDGDVQRQDKAIFSGGCGEVDYTITISPLEVER